VPERFARSRDAGDGKVRRSDSVYQDKRCYRRACRHFYKPAKIHPIRAIVPAPHVVFVVSVMLGPRVVCEVPIVLEAPAADDRAGRRTGGQVTNGTRVVSVRLGKRTDPVEPLLDGVVFVVAIVTAGWGKALAVPQETT
jgi:hypothetical protein